MPVHRFVSCLAVVAFAALALASPSAQAGVPHGFRVEILVDGRPLPQYPGGWVRDTTLREGLGRWPGTEVRSHYVEAVKGRNYSIRLHNPLGVRVAVALSVDGLNSIDARHTTARDARKWVLGPYETMTISGWQMSLSQARRFFFTTEDRSYASRLGRTEDMGIISAVFFRERIVRVVPLGITPAPGADSSGKQEPAAPGPTAKAPASGGNAVGEASHRAEAASPEDFAATGIGERVDHAVQQVSLNLEDHPVASFDIRYEYHDQLVRLGILPGGRADDGLARRGRAKGFEDGFCPDVK